MRSMSWHHFQQFIVPDSETTVAVESSSPERSSCDEDTPETEEAKVIQKDPHLNGASPFPPVPPTNVTVPRTQTDGASGHDPKTCRPCVFAASRKGCTRTMCEFCHEHPHRCSGRRPRKETRERLDAEEVLTEALCSPLRHADVQLRSDRRVVLEAVKQAAVLA
eukprot:Skav213202  [mRNA]  locus=scaffold2826:407169:412222:+ [translate_table: standard]